MADKRFDQIANAPSITNAAYFVGTFDNGDGTFSDYKYSFSQLVSAVSALTSKVITPASDSVSLTDTFFASSVYMIAMNSQIYVLGVDFSQNTSTNTVTLINGASFLTGQKILAKT
jgi:hypothetical protein